MSAAFSDGGANAEIACSPESSSLHTCSASELMSPPSSAAPSCAVCAFQLRRLEAMQHERSFRIVSHCYVSSTQRAQPTLTVLTRCSRCTLTLTWRAEELLKPDAAVCPTCALADLVRDRNAASAAAASSSQHYATAVSTAAAASPTAVSSAAAAAAPSHSSAARVSTASPTSDEDRPLKVPRTAHASAAPPRPPDPAAAGDAGASSSDEEVSIVAFLHRRVVSDAAQLKRRERRSADASGDGSVGSKAMPIELEDEDDEDAPISSVHRSHPLPTAAAAAAAVQASADALPASQPAIVIASRPAAQKPRPQPNVVVGRMKRKSSSDGKASSGSDAGQQSTSADGAAAAAGASAASAAPSAAASASGVPPSVFSSEPVRRPSRRMPGFDAASAAAAAIEFNFDPLENTVAARWKRQQELFNASRRRFETRRSLNLEPDPNAEPATLPFRTKAQQAASEAHQANVAAAAANASASVRTTPFTLPSWFRPERPERPYTPEERAQAMHHLIQLEEKRGPKHDALCLPSMQPRNWCTIVHAASKGMLSAEHGSSAGSLLAHHYRRLAKLVHPDKVDPAVRHTAEHAFKVLQEAYQHMLKLM